MLGLLVEPINAAPNITHRDNWADGCLQSACCCIYAQKHQLQGILEDCAVALVLQSSFADSQLYSQHMPTPKGREQKGRQCPQKRAYQTHSPP